MPRTVPALACLALGTTLLAACSGGSSAPQPSPRVTSASPSPSPSPVSVATCPLTGVPAKPGQKVHRVALAVKIDNVDEARPQSGLERADLVVEETVEGGLTRLFAVFQCSSAPTVGPIRSARTSDGDLLRLLDGAVFAYSGANPKAIAPVAATSKAVLIAYDSLPQYFHRDPSRPAPHNVYSSTATLLAAGLARNHKLDAPPPVFSYGQPAHRGQRARSVALKWPAASAAWSWNGKVWQRTQNGSADTVTGGTRVSADNVVVMSIAVKSTGLHDVLGNASPDDVVTGSGKVWVFRDGRVIRGTWSRPDRTKPMRLTDSHGKLLLLTPGQTWIELLPRPGKPTIS
ncbi:MAG TPA: DUF3048 domain-containing protein [Mycobacteriales bacterium]|nr:DUF3048 domain-containing protein [Mycobacteriales bacterium]